VGFNYVGLVCQDIFYFLLPSKHLDHLIDFSQKAESLEGIYL